MNIKHLILSMLTILFVLTACASPTTQSKAPLNVVATTSIVGDVVRQVGGDLVNVNILLPIGSDPHSYQPSPQDVAKISEATLVFANGAGLEEFLQNLIESAGAADRLVNVSEGIELKDFGAHEHEHEGEDEQEHEMHSHEGGDPHTWVDPNNVIIWVQNIETKLSQIDSVNSAIYQTNAENYIAQLKELDAWIIWCLAILLNVTDLSKSAPSFPATARLPPHPLRISHRLKMQFESSASKPSLSARQLIQPLHSALQKTRASNWSLSIMARCLKQVDQPPRIWTICDIMYPKSSMP
jgi:hypothetical protein